MATTGTEDQWSFNLNADDYSSLAPIKVGTVLNFGTGKELRVGSIEEDIPVPGQIKLSGSVILAESDLSGISRLSHEGFNPLSNLDDQDSSGGFSQTFYVSVKGEKGFTIHNSSEDAFSRLRAVKIESGSLFNSSLVKVAVTTTAQIQNVNVDTAGRVNVMLTDGTQYTRGQILLVSSPPSRHWTRRGATCTRTCRMPGFPNGVPRVVTDSAGLRRVHWSCRM